MEKSYTEIFRQGPKMSFSSFITNCFIELFWFSAWNYTFFVHLILHFYTWHYTWSCTWNYRLYIYDFLHELKHKGWKLVKIILKKFLSGGFWGKKASKWGFSKVVSATILLVCCLSLKEMTCETNFYFTSKALFILKKIKV